MLSLNALGVPQIRYGSQPLSVRGKPLGLLCWLALRGPASRAEATELLWPGEGSATLRQHLYLLRKLPGAAQWWSDEAQLRVHVQTDVAFLDTPLDAAGRERALEALSATLLEGLEHLPDPFVEWLELERQRLSLLRRTLLFDTALTRLAEGEIDLAAERLKLLLRLDPLHESACRELMRLEVERGQAQEALSQFETLREQLRREMNASPLPETVELARCLAAPPGGAEPEGVALLTLRQAVEVAGGERPELLARMLDQDPLTVAVNLDRLREAQLPRPVLAPTVLTVLHRRAAQALEELGGPDEAVADHLLRAGRPTEAGTVLVRAASAVRGTPDAARLARRALEYSPPVTDQARALGLLFSQAELTRDLAELEVLNAQLAALAFASQDDALYFQLYRQRMSAARTGGDLETALNWAEEALSLALRVGEPEWRAEAELMRGITLYFQGHLSGAEEALLRALEARTVETRLRAHSSLGGVYGTSDRLPEALEQQEACLTLSRAHAPRSMTAQVLYNLATTALRAGRWSRAGEGFREAALIFRETGAVALEAQALSALAHLHHTQGHFGEAWNTAGEVLELTAQGSMPAAVTALGVLADIARRCGQQEEAHRRYEQAHAAAVALGEPRQILLTAHNLTLLGVIRGDAPQRHLLAAMQEVGMEAQREECRAELALFTQDKATFTWASTTGSEAAVPLARALMDLAQLRASLRGWTATQAVEAAELQAIRAALPREEVTALTLWAAWHEGQGQREEAVRLHAEAEACARVQAQGLSRTLRAAYLTQVEQGWTTS